MVESTGEASRGWIGWLQVGVLAAAVIVGVYFARSPSLPPLDEQTLRSPAAPAVRVSAPSPGAHSLTVSLTGEVNARHPVALLPRAAGEVVAVSPSLRPGGTFRAGQTLVTIDSADAEIWLQRMEAVLAAERGRLRWHRDRGALDAQEYRERNPGATVPAAVRRLGKIERSEAQVRAAEADVKMAERQLEVTRLSVPFAGRVIDASVSVGQVVGGGGAMGGGAMGGAADSLATVFDGRLEVRAPISVADLAYLGDPRGLKATVVTAEGVFAASVTQVSAVLAPQTRLSTLVLDFAGTEGPLPMPGAFAAVSVRGPAYDGAYLLPDEAHRAGDSVWLVDDGRLRRQTPRTLGRTADGWIVEAFDVRDGVVLGAVPGERDGLAVTAIAGDEER